MKNPAKENAKKKVKDLNIKIKMRYPNLYYSTGNRYVLQYLRYLYGSSQEQEMRQR